MRALEQNGAIEILLLLLEKKEVKVTELLSYLRTMRIGQSSMYTALKLLLEEKLIEETIKDYPKLRLIKLSSKGRQVAEKLLEIKQILEQDQGDM